ncbi:MAG: T9SS type A sorting domain-containing protein [Chitinophagales bacterium]|nr:T9SS type A sorting domain-containing protein [Chitinophagales bacterium]
MHKRIASLAVLTLLCLLGRASNINLFTNACTVSPTCTNVPFALTMVNTDAVNPASFDLTITFNDVDVNADANFVLITNPYASVSASGDDFVTIQVVNLPSGSTTLSYSIYLPCELIPNSNPTGQTFYLDQTFSTSNVTNGFNVSLPQVLHCQLEFDYLSQASTSTGYNVSVPFGGSGIIRDTLINAWTNDFTGFIDMTADFNGCNATLGNFTYELISSQNVSSGVLPITFPSQINVQQGYKLVVAASVTMSDCSDCNFIPVHIKWGCQLNTCRDITKPLSIDVQNASFPHVSITRITPTEQIAWDPSCSGDETLWEYLIINEGSIPAENVRLWLQNTWANSFTFIQQSSVELLPVDSRFPQFTSPILPYPVGVFTAYGLQGTAASCANVYPQNDPAIQEYKFGYNINFQLGGGQALILRFKTYRCCASNVSFEDAMVEGINYNRWLLKGWFGHQCVGSDVQMYQGPDIPYSNNNSTHPLNEFNHWGGAISGNLYDADSKPDLGLSQSIEQTITDLTGGPNGTCGSFEEFQVVNWSFPSLVTNVSDYDADIFCPNYTGLPDLVGDNPTGKFRIEVTLPSNVELDGSIPLTITSGNITWTALTSWNQVTGGYEAFFDIDQGWAVNGGAIVAPATSRILRDFLEGPSTINLRLRACCPLQGSGTQQVDVATQFIPNPSGGCTDCRINLSKVPIVLNLHCPGCVTPGIIIEEFTLHRTNYDFEDINDDGLPEGANGNNQLIPIDITSYNPAGDIKRTASIIGDRLESTVLGRLQEGDATNTGFELEPWEQGCGGNVHLDHLYLEQIVPNVNVPYLNIDNSTTIELIHIRNSTATSHSIPFVPVPYVYGGNTFFTYYVDLSTLTPPIVIQDNDTVILKSQYSVCANPSDVDGITVNNLMYFTPMPLPINTPPSLSHPLLPDDWPVNGSPSCTDPNGAPLWVCEGMGGMHYIYPIKHQITHNEIQSNFFTNPTQCSKPGNVEVSYYIKGPGPYNAFPYEYRLMPDIDELQLDLGPQLSGTPGPVSFHLNVPDGFEASVVNLYTRANDYRCFNVPIPSAIGNSGVVPNTSVTGPASMDFFPDLTSIEYMPMYTTVSGINANPINGFIPAPSLCPPAQNNVPFQYLQFNSQPILLLSDESFTQGIQYKLRALCSSDVDETTITNNDFSATIPNYADGCNPANQDIEVHSNAAPITISQPIFQLQAQFEAPVYNQSTVTFSFTLTTPAGATASNAMVYFNTDLLPSDISLNGFFFHNPSPQPIIGSGLIYNGGNYFMFPLGEIAGTYYYSISFNYDNCNVLTSTDDFLLPLSYNWNCDGYILPEPNGGQPEDNCSQPQSVTLDLTPPEVFADIVNSEFPYLNSCSPYSFTTTLHSVELGGIGNIIGEIYLPEEIIVDGGFSLSMDNQTPCAITPTSFLNNGNGYNVYTFDLTNLTSFADMGTAPCVDNMVGFDGMNSVDGSELTISFDVHTTACTTIDPAYVVFSGIYYCGTQFSQSDSFNIDPDGFAVPVSNNCFDLPNFSSQIICSTGVYNYLFTASDNANFPITADWDNMPGIEDTFDETDPNPHSTAPVGGFQPGQTYTLTVTDASGTCSQSITATINYPVEATAIGIDALCYGLNGTISITNVTGGSPDPLDPPTSYTYIFNGQTHTFTTPFPHNIPVPAGTYNITVQVDHPNGTCTDHITVTINQPQQLAINVVEVVPACNTGNDGSITVNVTGGILDYDYNWNPNVSNGPVASNLAPGLYTLQVYDQNHCPATLSIDVPELLEVVVDVIHTCNNECNGEIALNVTSTGSNSILTYGWQDLDNSNPLPPTASITNLCAGQYAYTVTESPTGCTVTDIVEVNPSTLIVLDLDFTQVTCYGDEDGSASVGVVSGGVAPFEYEWSSLDPQWPHQTTPSINNLPAGTYTVVVTDANGCFMSGVVTVLSPDPIVINLSQTMPISCVGSTDGELSTNVTGGNGGYTFAWTAPITDPDPSAGGLGAGTYTVTVTDMLNCQASESITISDPPAFAMQMYFDYRACDIDDRAIVYVNFCDDNLQNCTPGTPGYTFSWSSPNCIYSNLPPLYPTTITVPGTYTLTITDANGCSIVQPVTIEHQSPINITPTVVNADCGTSNGSITLTVTGGVENWPYEYQWSPSGPNSPTNTNLAPGSYVVTVSQHETGLYGNEIWRCEEILHIKVLGDFTPQVEVTNACFGESNGSIEILNPQTGDYYTLWEGTVPYPSYNPVYNGLAPGQYTIVVGNSITFCIGSITVTVGENPEIVMINNAGSYVHCFGESSGSIIPIIGGGTQPYHFQWGAPIPSGQSTDANQYNLYADSYPVTITDDIGCTLEYVYDIIEPAQFVIVPYNVTPASSCNANDGSVLLGFGGGPYPDNIHYSISFNNGMEVWYGPINTGPVQLNNLVPGSYTIDAYSSSFQCPADEIIVEIGGGLNIDAIIQPASCHNFSDGTANIDVSNATGTVHCIWTTLPGPPDQLSMTGLAAGSYPLTIYDDVCTTSYTITVTEPDQIIPSIAIVAEPCNDATGELTVIAVGGSGNFNFVWSSSDQNWPHQLSQTISNLVANTYTVTVSEVNNNNCFAVASIDLLNSQNCCKHIYGEFVESFDDVTIADGNEENAFNIYASTFSDWMVATGTPSIYGNGDIPGVIADEGLQYAVLRVCDQSSSNLLSEGLLFSYPFLTAGNYVISASLMNIPIGTNSGVELDLYLLQNPINYNYQSGVDCMPTDPVPFPPDAFLLTTFSNIQQGTWQGQSITFSNLPANYNYLWFRARYTNPNIQQDPAMLALDRIIIQYDFPNSLLITDVVDNISCHGACDGSIDISIAGGTPQYNIYWNGLPTSGPNPPDPTLEDQSNLCPGLYIVNVTDLRGCTASASFNITEPAEMVLNATATPLSNCNANDGQIDLTFSGGSGDFVLSWGTSSVSITSPTTSWNIAGLSAGNYVLTLMDVANGCTVSTTVQVTGGIIVNAQVNPETCLGQNGSIYLNPSGGLSGYSFNWINPSGQFGNAIYGLSAGTYTVLVTDMNQCSTLVNIEVPLIDDFQLSYTVVEPSCHGYSNGNIVFNPSGGIGGYQFHIVETDPNNNVFYDVWSGNYGFYDLSAGEYSATVTDIGSQCSLTINFTIEEPDPLVVSLTHTDAYCGSDNGTVTVDVSGGTPGYTYTWTMLPSGQQFFPWQNGNSFNGFGGSNYELTVTDDNGCSHSQQFTILQTGFPLVQTSGIDPICTASNGTLMAQIVGGGVGPYTFQWFDDNGDPVGQPSSAPDHTIVSVADQPAGQYFVVVFDANQCQSGNGVELVAEIHDVNVFVDVDNPCTIGAEVNAVAIPSGGTESYSYHWHWDTPTPTDDYTEDISNLQAGVTYSLTVTDANGCSGTASVVGPEECCIGYFKETHTIVNDQYVTDHSQNGYLIFPERAFIAQNLIIPPTVNIVDITNCDVVFNEHTLIELQGNTHLRANNSVFRPCSENTNWSTILFRGNSTGQVNECTFKNATCGLFMFNVSSGGVSANSNLFRNCIIGILAAGGHLTEEITGNSFVRDNNYHPYLPLNGNPPLFPPAENRGIYLYYTAMDKMISDNSFIYSDISPIQLSYGIYSESSDATISQNNFINLYRALEATGDNSSLTFASNTISYDEGGNQNTAGIHAISVINSTVGIYYIGANEINYSHQSAEGNLPFGDVAIYAEDIGDRMIIAQNEIKGFNIGIQAKNVNDLTVAANKIYEFLNQGIYVEGCGNAMVTLNEIHGIGFALPSLFMAGIHAPNPLGGLFITKNIIRMHGIADIDDYDQQTGLPTYHNLGISNGIEYAAGHGYNTMMHRIRENCIYDCQRSIFLFDGPNTDYSIPAIVNNHLYNYTDAGLFIQDYYGHPNGALFGDIGNNTDLPFSAGRNTFVSNFLPTPDNWGNALDIESTNPIWSFGNSADLRINNNVQILSPDVVYTSNASCAGVLGNSSNEYHEDLFPLFMIREESNENESEESPLFSTSQLNEIKKMMVKYPVEKNGLGVSLVSGYLDSVELAEGRRAQYSSTIITMLAKSEAWNDIELFYNDVITSGLLSQDEEAMVRFTYFTVKNDDSKIAALLNQFSPSDSDLRDWVSIQKINYANNAQGILLSELSQAELNILQDIIRRNGKYASLARTKLNSVYGGFEYQFKQAIPPHAPKDEMVIATQGNTAYVFPNPFDQGFRLVYRIEDNIKDAYAIVTDVLGRNIITVPLDKQNGTLDFDLSPYANGFYLLTIFNDGEQFSVNRLVKN